MLVAMVTAQLPWMPIFRFVFQCWSTSPFMFFPPSSLQAVGVDGSDVSVWFQLAQASCNLGNLLLGRTALEEASSVHIFVYVYCVRVSCAGSEVPHPLLACHRPAVYCTLCPGGLPRWHAELVWRCVNLLYLPLSQLACS